MDFMKAVEAHHSYVKALADEHNDYQVIWTAAIGSQNYGLADENSDCDTFTIVLPNYLDFISKTNLISFETNMSDGKCVVKDFRLMMNLLRKTSPNSVEVFLSKYKIFEPAYELIEKTFFNSDSLYYLSRANYKHMLCAIAGMAAQLHGRNMTEGKRFSHALRLDDMQYWFLNQDNITHLFDFRFGGVQDMARIAKFKEETEEETNYYKEEGLKIAEKLKIVANNFQYTPKENAIEYTANHLINRLQFEVTKIYLEQNHFEYKG